MSTGWFSVSSRWCRAALSLASATLSSIIVCAFVIACKYQAFSSSLTSWFLFIRGAVLVIILAWIITLPLVVLISRIDGWRLWLLGVSGMLVGPALLLVLSLWFQLADSSQKFRVSIFLLGIVESWKVMLVVTAISLAATAIYLGILGLSLRRRAP